jgi:protein gp37
MPRSITKMFKPYALLAIIGENRKREMGKTKIEWTRGDDESPGMTWNPVTGCTKVSPGCLNCYAETIDRRFQHDGPHVPWTVHAQAKAGVAAVHLHPDRLEMPLRWRKPRRVFVNSMSDLFHKDVPFEFVAQVWETMRLAHWHTFLVLTKRPERMHEFIHTYGPGNVTLAELTPLPNVWLGVSVENQRLVDERLPILAQVPTKVRFVSAEPLLGPLDLKPYFFKYSGCGVKPCACKGLAIHQVIIGGESGPGARPMDLVWARDLVHQCKQVGVACFVKQLGRNPIDSEILWDSVDGKGHLLWDSKGGDMDEWPEDLRVREMPEVGM